MKIKQLVIYPKEESIAKILGERHTKIMEFAWENGEVTTRDLVNKLEYGKANTASTALYQLYQRDLLKRKKVKKPRPHYLYKPVITKNKLIEKINKILDETKNSLVKDKT